MSNLNRLQALKQFCDEEPDNPFNWYALALECRNSDPALTAQLFDQLLTSHESYLPTYFPAAHFFGEREQIDRAVQLFERGIALAQEQNETKAFQELSNALQNFRFENDLD